MKNFRIFVKLFSALFLIPLHGAVNPLQQEIDAAVKRGDAEIHLSRKEYRLETPVLLHNLRSRIIDGHGARIVMTRLNRAFLIHGSRDLTLRNFSIDYDPLPYTQGRVTLVEKNRLEFLIDAGYPTAEIGRYTFNAHAFTPDGRHWKKYQPDIYAKPEPSGGGKMRLDLIPGMSELTDVQVGDRIALTRHPADIAAVDMRETGRIAFENITVFASPGCVFRGYHCDGDDRYENVKILRGQLPRGATEQRLLSANHDAIHYGYCRKGPRILSCEFSYMGDDGLNLHGNTSVLAEVTGRYTFNQLLGSKTEKSDLLSRLRAGDKIRILDKDNFRILGEYTFRSYRRIDRLYPKELRDRFFPHLRKKSADVQTTMEITVNEPLTGIEGDARWDSPAVCCNGYEIRDSYYHDHRARGLRVMASNGLIENCCFERIKGAAISIGAEYAFWGEAGWVDNVTVRNCKIREVGYGSSGSAAMAARSYVPGAISIFVQLSSYRNVFPGHRNIILEGNTIEGTPFAGIFLNAARGVKLSGNSLTRVSECSFPAGKKWNFTNPAPIWIMNSTEVVLP